MNEFKEIPIDIKIDNNRGENQFHFTVSMPWEMTEAFYVLLSSFSQKLASQIEGRKQNDSENINDAQSFSQSRKQIRLIAIKALRIVRVRQMRKEDVIRQLAVRYRLQESSLRISYNLTLRIRDRRFLRIRNIYVRRLKQEGLTYKQIATQCQMTIGNVQKVLNEIF